MAADCYRPVGGRLPAARTVCAMDTHHRPRRRAHRRAAAASVVALAAVVASTATARADTVSDWNGYASNAIVATAGQPPPVAGLSFALVPGAGDAAGDPVGPGHPALPAPPPR